jgi:hypothetical protein
LDRKNSIGVIKMHSWLPIKGSQAGWTNAYGLQSFTYNYWSNYGSPEVDRKAEKVRAVRVSSSSSIISISCSLRAGKV